MNNYADYGATDAAYIELNYSNKAAKIRIGGATGWVKNGEYTIIPIRIMTPTRPKLDAYTANIKSVDDSGKYIGVLFNPYPNNPPDPIAESPFSN